MELAKSLGDRGKEGAYRRGAHAAQRTRKARRAGRRHVRREGIVYLNLGRLGGGAGGGSSGGIWLAAARIRPSAASLSCSMRCSQTDEPSSPLEEFTSSFIRSIVAPSCRTASPYSRTSNGRAGCVAAGWRREYSSKRAITLSA